MPEGGILACRSPLDEVAAVSYVLTEAQYAANEAGDTWVQVRCSFRPFCTLDPPIGGVTYLCHGSGVYTEYLWQFI